MVSAGALALLLPGSGKATNAQVVAAGDDGTSFGSSTFWSNSTADVWLGIENNVAAHTMYRMRLHVPQGATITKAYSRLRARGTDSGTTVNVRIYAEDVDNATTGARTRAGGRQRPSCSPRWR